MTIKMPLQKYVDDATLSNKWEEILSNTLTSDGSYIKMEFPTTYNKFMLEVYTPMVSEASNAMLYPHSTYDNNGTATNITLPAWTFQTGQQAHWLTVIFSVKQLDTEKHFQIETISRTAGNNNTSQSTAKWRCSKISVFQ